MFFASLLPPTRDRIESWRVKGLAKPILKALTHRDAEIKRHALHALGQLVGDRAIPREELLVVYRQVLDFAKLPGVNDQLLWECVYTLRHFEGREARDFFHSLLERDTPGKPPDPSLLDWVIIGLCDGLGDGESCQLVLRLIDQGRLSYHHTGEFRDRGGSLLRKSINAGGIDSEVLHLYCRFAAKDSSVGGDAKYLLYRAYGADSDPTARRIIRSWLQSKHAAVRAYAGKFLGEDEKLPPDERKLVEMIKAVADGKEHATNLSIFAGQMGAAALPVLRRFLEQDPAGELGRAAVIGLQFVSPRLALPLIAKALQSEWAAVRHYAADYLLVKQNRSDAGRELARHHLQTEAEDGVRRLLEQAANS